MSQPALRLDPSLPAAEPASPPTPASVLDTTVAEQKLDLAAILRAITTQYGKSYQQVLLEIAKTSFGPGRLRYDEYISLRLFDDLALNGADKTAFVGLDASRRIWRAANHNTEWWGFMANKLAVTTLLGGFGFPVIPTLALYSEARSLRAFPVFHAAAALANFLRSCDAYPLFGKPMDSQRSLGSASLQAYDRPADSLLTPEGAIPVESFVADVAQHYGAGYLLQRHVTPHPGVRAICGDRLATVRVMTILTDEGPEILRALWKIPAGSNVADNFWRPGNLLATLDLESGRVVRVVCNSGLQQQTVTRHPDTGAQLIGLEVPNWREIIALSLDAASALAEVPLLGWDMAAVDNGAVIVEPNFTPDFFMPQLADRRGIFDQRMRDFLASCKAGAQHARQKLRSDVVHENRARLRRLGRDVAGG